MGDPLTRIGRYDEDIIDKCPKMKMGVIETVFGNILNCNIRKYFAL